jgi:hypothetical protein
MLTELDIRRLAVAVVDELERREKERAEAWLAEREANRRAARERFAQLLEPVPGPGEYIAAGDRCINVHSAELGSSPQEVREVVQSLFRKKGNTSPGDPPPGVSS